MKLLKYRKMTLWLYLLIIITITLSSLTAAISTAGASDILTINDAIRLALKNNSDLQLEKQDIGLYEVLVNKNKGLFYPDLTLDSGGSYKAEQIKSTDYKTFDLTLTSTFNIFNGLKDSSALKKSEVELEAEKKRYTRAHQTCIYSTLSNYLEVVSNEKLIESEAENLIDNRKQLEQLQAYYESGKSSITDLYKQQAETKEAELGLLSAKNNFKVSMLKLTQSMGLGTGDTFNVSFPEVVFNEKTFPDYGYDALLATAYQTRSDIESGEKLIDAAEEGIREAKGGFLPSVDVYAEMGSDYSSSYEEGFNNQLIESGVSSAIGFKVSIPVFDRFVTRANLSEAKINKRKYLLEQKSLKQEIQLEIGEALEAYQTAVKQLDVTTSLLKYSKKVVDSMIEKYASGASSINDLIEARSDYTSAKCNHITAGYDLIKQKAALAYYKGDLTGMMAVGGMVGL